MNSDHEIYRAAEDQIPEADKARLDGFLAGRAEADEIERLRREFEAKHREFETMATSLRER